MKNKGGRRREAILSQNWTLSSDVHETSLAKTPTEEVAKLTEQVNTLQSQVKASTHVLRQIQQETPMHRKRTAKHYSQRHERRLKKQRIEECSAALSWLEEDGLTPVSVTFLNKESNELEKITI